LNKVRRNIYILFALLLFAAALLGEGISLVHANITIGKLEAGQKITIFKGNVHFRQDTLEMYCDSAVYYEKEEYADFDGNVIVLDGLRTLRADKIKYYPSEKTAYCYDHVRIVSDVDSMYAESLVYNFNTRDANAAVNFFARDEKENVEISAEKGEYIDLYRRFTVLNNSVLTRVDTTTSDTLWIYAQKIEYFATDSAKAIASDSVSIIQKELNTTSDTAVYFIDKQIIWLKHKPIATYDKNKLSGKIIKVELDSLEIRKIFSFEDANALETVDSLAGKYNELKAKTIELQIFDNKPQQMIASGNAVSQYYLRNDEGGQGMNIASADTLLLFFTDGEMDSLMIVGGSEGVYYPENYHGEKKIEKR